VTLYGTDGGAKIGVENYATEDTLRIYSDVGGAPAEIRPQVLRGQGHRAVVRDFVSTIRGGDWTSHVGRDGLARARIIDACYQSALEGREVPVLDLL
jgi:predicted dehydrogenase